MTSGDGAPFRALLVDLGGVILQNHWRRVAEELAEELPIDPLDAFRILVELSPPLDLGDDTLEQFYRNFVATLGTAVPFGTFSDATLESGLRLIDANVELLVALRASPGIREIAVSNMAEEIWDAVERKFRLSRLLDGVVLSSRVHALKPDPIVYGAALELAGCTAGEAVFIDDSEVNVRGAQAMGIRSVLVSGDPLELRSALEPCFLGSDRLG